MYVDWWRTCGCAADSNGATREPTGDYGKQQPAAAAATIDEAMHDAADEPAMMAGACDEDEQDEMAEAWSARTAEYEIRGEMTMAVAAVAEVEATNEERHDDDAEVAIGGTTMGGAHSGASRRGTKRKRPRGREQANLCVRQHKARRSETTRPDYM